MLSRFGSAIIFHIICFFYIIYICVRQRLTWHCKARAGKKRRAIFLRRRPRRRDKGQTCARRHPLQSRRRCVGARVGMCAVYRPQAPTKKHYPDDGASGFLPRAISIRAISILYLCSRFQVFCSWHPPTLHGPLWVVVGGVGSGLVQGWFRVGSGLVKGLLISSEFGLGSKG